MGGLLTGIGAALQTGGKAMTDIYMQKLLIEAQKERDERLAYLQDQYAGNRQKDPFAQEEKMLGKKTDAEKVLAQERGTIEKGLIGERGRVEKELMKIVLIYNRLGFLMQMSYRHKNG